ncbi:hypothetical protein EYR41_002483 [Orbilia oligospora]|uniref:Uncharacterized protein n=1 Tax=Orbilia oligospora TaxID=2813651 RepID=A0A8H2HKE9_ORBOL|nr:hypothetical protein TWF132_010741 [Orbilia oligospora]TGJ62508.1 hypothetical protein EYR41_002483 [Orbilia oligospora]
MFSLWRSPIAHVPSYSTQTSQPSKRHYLTLTVPPNENRSPNYAEGRSKSRQCPFVPKVQSLARAVAYRTSLNLVLVQ